MSKQTGTRIVFTFFFIIIVLLGNKIVSFPPATDNEPIITETISRQSGKGPHSKLERTHFHLIAKGHTLIQKNIIPFYLLTSAVRYDLNVALENFQIRRLSHLIKGYLFHIYPSHNFW